MIGWLGDWLRDIIAVVLLAVFIELLIPSKTMLRYIRLVIGLFILLTIMSPILRLFQGDIQAKLDEGMRAWTEMSSQKRATMPTLEQIQQKAQQLSEDRDKEAFKLTEKALEQAIHSELEKQTGTIIASVDAELDWSQHVGKDMPVLTAIMITLKSSEEQSGTDNAAVEAVVPVTINVELEERQSNSEERQSSADDGTSGKQLAEDENWQQADPRAANAIRSIIVQGWGIESSIIHVRQPASN